jgi:HPt (histidine-containing phosphotransfer) domain-containing protein
MISIKGSGSGEGFSAVASLDRALLSENTMGEPALQREVLGLFGAQLRQVTDQLVHVEDPRDWRFLSHTLRGAAAAVGAVEIRELATRWEKLPVAAMSAKREQARQELQHAAERFFEAAQSFLGSLKH